MSLELQKIHEIINQSHVYYNNKKYAFMRSGILIPNTVDLLNKALRSSESVLGIGCGNGKTLLDNSGCFNSGIGTDSSLEHIKLANTEKGKRKIDNVEFQRGISHEMSFPEGSFDLIFSERGPLAGSSINIQAAMHVLKIGGCILAETPGELNHCEVSSFFFPQQARAKYRHMRRIEEVKVLFERNGVELEVLSEYTEKHHFSDFYDWLKYQCSVWSYLEIEIPSAESIDMYERFYELNGNNKGEVVVTSHMVWVGGRKISNAPEYWEYKHF